MPLIVGDYSDQVFFKLAVIFPRPLNSFDNMGNDGVLALGCYLILVSKVPEILVLLHNLSVLDNHLLIHVFALFNHMNVGHLSPGCTTIPGIIKELGNSFLVQLLRGDPTKSISSLLSEPFRYSSFML